MRVTTEITMDPLRAAEILATGGIVALPTETVYGLAARYDDASAVARIFTAKERPADNPLIVHVADTSWLGKIAREIPDAAAALLRKFAPGPLTVTLPRAATVSDLVTAGLESVAVRIPAAPLFQTVLHKLGIPLVAPSANRSGRPSPTTWQAVQNELEGRIDAILVGPPCEIGVESTVVDCCQTPPQLLRPGGIALEELQSILPEIKILTHHAPTSPPTDQLPSPGLRYRHYAPSIPVRLADNPAQIEADPRAMLLTTTPHPSPQRWGDYECFETLEDYTRSLFSAFRRAEKKGLATVYCQRVPERGLGRALMDRLRRAAEASR